MPCFLVHCLHYSMLRLYEVDGERVSHSSAGLVSSAKATDRISSVTSKSLGTAQVDKVYSKKLPTFSDITSPTEG